MKNRSFIIYGLLLVLILLFTGCGDQDNPPGEDGPGSQQTIISNTINIAMEKVKSLNPIISSDEDVFFMSKLLYRSLFVLDDNLTAQADLVDTYEYLADGSLTLTLKKDVFWEDGNALTAGDVKLTVDAIMALGNTSDSLYLDSAKALRSCKVDKDGRIVIAFSGGDKGLENLLFPIMPAHKYKRPADLLKDTNKFMPLGTGSYKIEKLEEGEYISLVGSSAYKGSVPGNNLVFHFLRNKDDAINLFGTREVNLALLRQVDRGTLVASDKIEVKSFVSNEVEVLVFNTRAEDLADKRLRRALGQVLDRESIVHNSYFQSGVISDSLYYPGYLGVKVDPIKKVSGLSLDGLSLNLIYNEENNSRKLAADLIKNQLEEEGAKITVTGLANEDYQQALQRGDYQLAIAGYKLNRKYDLSPVLHSNGGLNYAYYSNPDMDEALGQIRGTMSEGAMKKVYGEIQELYREDLPYLSLLYKTYGLAVTKGLTGEIKPSFDNIYKGIENWQIIYQVDQ